MVDIIHWNPKVRFFKKKFLRKIPINKKTNNFGDLIGPLVANTLLKQRGLINSDNNKKRLLTVGSIIHFAQTDDTIWGSGILGNAKNELYQFTDLDIRAVRGPLTRKFLQENFSIKVPEIYGDPALLIPSLFPEIKQKALHKKKYALTIIPHFLEYESFKHLPNTINPQAPLFKILDRIAQSELVVGSSLHAIIIAEAFGVPSQLYQSHHEHLFKYQDYYEGTGRNKFIMAKSIEEAIKLGGEPPCIFDPSSLIEAFPYDLWEQ